MKALFVTHSYPRTPGDLAGSFLLRLAIALRDEDVQVRVLAPAAPGLAARDTFDGIPVERFRYSIPEWETLAYTGTMAEQVSASGAGKIALLGMIAGGAIAVRAAVATARPDVIHSHWWFPLGVSVALARVTPPVVTTMHGSDVRLAAGSTRAPGVFRWVVEKSAAVTTVSKWLAEEARGMAPNTSIGVEPMPVDTALFTPGGVRERARFLFVGRLNAQKGIALLLDALARLDADATLDVVGGGDLATATALRAKAVELGIADRIEWHGPLAQPALVPLYRRATAVVMPSENEGLGLVAVEAQLCETPVIAFRSGGVTDLIHDGETGLLTQAGSVTALAEAMRSLTVADGRGAKLGAAGRAAALERVAPAPVAKRYRAIYDRVTRA